MTAGYVVYMLLNNNDAIIQKGQTFRQGYALEERVLIC